MTVPVYLASLALLALIIAGAAALARDIRRICRAVRLYETGLAQEQPLSPLTTAGDAPHRAVTGEASTIYDWEAVNPVGDVRVETTFVSHPGCLKERE